MANKMKTHSGAKKRFKKMKSGAIKFSRAYRRHLLTKKTAKRKRQLRGGGFLLKCDEGHVKNLLP